ncbi:MAG: STAS/SEC14 domain-containing protein [Aggregatilineales bacterium]|nr:STAS/SEC14 domain-containing protein [Aggregatilineales bacterium]
MPYDFEWLDENRNIVAIRLSSPVSPEELKELHARVMPLTESPLPIYILADIRNFDLLTAYSQLGDALKTLSLPSMDNAKMQGSRVAILGGGPLVGLVLSFAKDYLNEGDDLVKAFNNEDEARSWLQEAGGGSIA